MDIRTMIELKSTDKSEQSSVNILSEQLTADRLKTQMTKLNRIKETK